MNLFALRDSLRSKSAVSYKVWHLFFLIFQVWMNIEKYSYENVFGFFFYFYLFNYRTKVY